MEPHMAAQRNQNFLFATTEGHSSDIGTTEFWGSHLGPQQQRLNGAPSKLSPFLSLGWGKRDGDEHGPHYRSCATEWGWREGENRPPYKRPKAIVQARTRKHNSIANPPFTRKENLSLVSSGGARGDQDEPGNNPYSSKNLESRRGVVHLCLPGRARPTLPLMRYRVGMERR